MKRLYFINGKYLGQSPIPPHLSWQANFMWYCDSCGEVYARLPTEGDGPRHWQGMVGICGKCQPRQLFAGRLPGSIWDTTFVGLHKDFPEGVLRYELLLLIANIEKEIEEDGNTEKCEI
jgi:hypothetical protein